MNANVGTYGNAVEWYVWDDDTNDLLHETYSEERAQEIADYYNGKISEWPEDVEIGDLETAKAELRELIGEDFGGFLS